MKTALSIRIITAVAATVVTLVLFDHVASMGQYPGPTAAVFSARVAVA
jgi:hypothetical protein